MAKGVRRIVGIDLGTTHTVVAWADTTRRADNTSPQIFPIPQLVTAREIGEAPLFSSVLYAPLEGEVDVDPWGDAPWVLGEFARRRGGEIPGRLVASSKSWLCHSGVDRTASILPWGADEVSDAPRISPVDAAAKILSHVKRAWDNAFPAHPLAEQDVILTVPASFDEVARKLTLEASQKSGLSVRLLEEPQAAFYNYMHHAGNDGIEALALRQATGRDGTCTVLVCDVGGGTTDLSLIRVARSEAGKAVSVKRIAVGSHLLLGGDNMDLALSHLCESRMVQAPGKLDPARFGQLVLACRTAKERLLAQDPPSAMPVTLLTSGARLVGSTLSTSLHRDEVESIVLDGFFPKTSREEAPKPRRAGLVAFGLPYERDVAITRHIAAFVDRHVRQDDYPRGLLLNGGVFRSSRIVEHLASAICAWGGPPIEVLPHDDADIAVACGAVIYGLTRLGQGIRIGGGSARGYYVGIDSSTADATPRAVCVVPRGAQEGVVHVADGPTLALVVGSLVRFDLYASDSATHDPGDIVGINSTEFQALPPVTAAFERGTARGTAARKVVLEGELSPIGTLELSCAEIGTSPPESQQRYKLAFQLRSDSATSSMPPSRSVPPPSSLDGKRLDEAIGLVERAFGKEPNDASIRAVKDLVRDLERLLGFRASWTTELTRNLFDALYIRRAARRHSPDHERVFWLLAGYCIRPGFGALGDNVRVQNFSSLFLEKITFSPGPSAVRAWQQFWIAWRRAAGGLSEAMQVTIRDAIDPFLAPSEAGLKKSKKWRPEALGDMLEMASTLERVPQNRRAALGDWIVERTWATHGEKGDPKLWAALGRLGARVPAYASIHHVVPASVAERWLVALLREKWEQLPTAVTTAVQLARVTGDRARDVSEYVRMDVEKRLITHGADSSVILAVREIVPVDESTRVDFFGEGLPVGLKLVA